MNGLSKRHNMMLYGIVLTGTILFPLFSAQVLSADSWVKIGMSGLGDPANYSIRTMAFFGDYLYTATSVTPSSGSIPQIWRITPGSTSGWDRILIPFRPDSLDINAMLEFRGHLYAGTDTSELWRIDRSGVPSRATPPEARWNLDLKPITSMTVFKGHLYIAREGPAELWRTGNGRDFELVMEGGFGDSANNYSVELISAGRNFYAGTTREAPGSSGDGCEIWRTSDGMGWSQINVDGFGAGENSGARSLIMFSGYLHVGTINHGGAQIWKYDGISPGSDGSGWERVDLDIFNEGVWINPRVQSATVFANRLYIGEGNPVPEVGAKVWSTRARGPWAVESEEGFGSSENRIIEDLASSFPFLYASTYNTINGSEVWMRVPTPLELAWEELGNALVDIGEQIVKLSICSQEIPQKCPVVLFDIIHDVQEISLEISMHNVEDGAKVLGDVGKHLNLAAVHLDKANRLVEKSNTLKEHKAIFNLRSAAGNFLVKANDLMRESEMKLSLLLFGN